MSYYGHNAAELLELPKVPTGNVYHHGVRARVGTVFGIVNGLDPATARAWAINQFTKIDTGFDYMPLRNSTPSSVRSDLVAYVDQWSIESGRRLYRVAPFDALPEQQGNRLLKWDAHASDGAALTARAAILAFITRAQTKATGACLSLPKFYSSVRNINASADGFGSDDLDHSAQYNYSLVRTWKIWAAMCSEMAP